MVQRQLVVLFLIWLQWPSRRPYVNEFIFRMPSGQHLSTLRIYKYMYNFTFRINTNTAPPYLRYITSSRNPYAAPHLNLAINCCIDIGFPANGNGKTRRRILSVCNFRPRLRSCVANL